jgi:hypothetical protein
LGYDIKRNIASNAGHLGVDSDCDMLDMQLAWGTQKCMQNFGLETFLKMALNS